MALTRVYEEHEVAPEMRRIYADVRASFDLPFVPSLFKLCAGVPGYLKMMWSDLGPVVRSREFQASALALEEFVRSLVVSYSWEFSDQARVLAEQKFSPDDTRQFAAIVAMFARATPRLVLFGRLMQRGYSGGQAGRISAANQASALAKLVTLHVPSQGEAGLRTWLIYRDIQKTSGASTVPSLFRVISLFPGYLASVWVEAKKVMREESFQQGVERASRRALVLLNGLPARDQRAHARHITPALWTEIEQTGDAFSRLLPQYALMAAIWEHSFPRSSTAIVAA